MISRTGEKTGKRGAARAVLLGLALAAGLSAWTAAASVPPAPSGPTDESCLMCHKDASLARAMGREGSLTVQPGEIGSSAHRRLTCVKCHRDATSSRHPPRLEKVLCVRCHPGVRDTLALSVHRKAAKGTLDESCATCHGTGHNVAVPNGQAMCGHCHQDAVKDYDTSVHGVARMKGDMDAAGCKDCHGMTHEVRAHRDTSSAISRNHIDDTCAHCHADRKLVERRRITIPDAVQLFRDSVHGRSTKDEAARCTDCHGWHTLKRASDPTSTVYRSNIPGTCAHCHPKQVAAYRIGVHGTALARGVTAAPVCTDCHGEHMIRGPKDPDSPVASVNVAETCSRCHDAAGVRETFGLPAGRLSTYRDSFHGLAARGGSPVVANCASCHGYHDILPSSDPRSLISPQRLPQTCGRCHAGAGTNFRMGRVHVAMATPNRPILYWTRWLYLMLIAGTIGFMALHNGLDYVRKVRGHLLAQVRELPPHAHALSRWFVRMTLAERIQHGLLAVSFFTLVYTGFALKFPESPLFSWLARMEGGYKWRGDIHRIAAVVMVATSLFHVAYLFGKRGRRLVLDLLPRPQDALDLIQNMLYLTGLRKEPARFDRFGYIEKAEYWALIWGTLVMTVTGCALWFENVTLSVLPKWALDLATIIHYYEAWLAFLAIVVWHLYTNISNPDVYPMNWTWLTGKISEAQLHHEHRIEWERMVAEEAARLNAEAQAAAKAAAAAAAAAPQPSAPAAPAAPPPTSPQEPEPDPGR